jgi:hypothetical protein
MIYVRGAPLLELASERTIAGRRGREKPRMEMRWEQVDWKVLQPCGEFAPSYCYSVLVWVQHSGAGLGSSAKYTFLVDSLIVSLVFTRLCQPSLRESLSTANRTKTNQFLALI